MRKVDVQTGNVLQSHALPSEDFGEGVTRHGNRLYQLVWLQPTVWSYPVHNLGHDVQQHQSDLTYVMRFQLLRGHNLASTCVAKRHAHTGMGGASRATARTSSSPTAAPT